MSAIDVTAQLGRATERRGGWTAAAASLVAWVYSVAHGLDVDFDGDAGEAWVRLIDASRPVAYLNVHVPLLLSTGTTWTWPYPVVVVALADLDTTLIRCAPDLLSDVFGRQRLQDRIDPDSFTAAGLWYATV